MPLPSGVHSGSLALAALLRGPKGPRRAPPTLAGGNKKTTPFAICFRFGPVYLVQLKLIEFGCGLLHVRLPLSSCEIIRLRACMIGETGSKPQ
jgi:hypothetical protein